jgi:hypothetical protein
MEMLILFIVMSIVNVIIQTVKSIATIKCKKGVASIVNAVAYGLYTVVVIYMVCDLPLWFKIAVVAIANLIGVYLVKYFEEKNRKDKLWKVEATINKEDFEKINGTAKSLDLSYNYVDIEKYYLFNFYCPTQKESEMVKGLLNSVNAKYFVNESKSL